MSASKTSEPDAKRLRPSFPETDSTNIETKYAANQYNTVEELGADFNYACDGLLRESLPNGHQMNGETPVQAKTDGGTTIRQLREILNSQIRLIRELDESVREDGSVNGFRNEENDRPLGQVLSLRTYTDRGPRQVYSGLQSDPSARLAGKTLPNGFELIDASPAETSSEVGQKKRTFGEVFTNRASKPLNMPRNFRPRPGEREIGFLSQTDALLSQISSHNKHNYSFTRIPPGLWLTYGGKSTPYEAQQRRGLKSEQESSSHEIDLGELTQKAYSSFAPSFDSSSAVVPSNSSDALWWNENGLKPFESTFTPHNAIEPGRLENSITETHSTASAEVFDLENFSMDPMLLADEDDESSAKGPIDDVDAVLKEVSDLIENLLSQQQVRQLDQTRSRKAAEPEGSEIEIHNILRTQLSLIIDSLPPSAVTRLNGDKLRRLNITSQIMLDQPDYVGSGESEGYAIRRPAPNAPVAAPTRQAVPNAAPIRPNTLLPQQNASLANYNARARAYNAVSGGPTQQVGPNTVSFQTQRPVGTPTQPSYLGRPYQPAGSQSYTSQQALQQFQRPVQNGYSAYTPNNNASTTGHTFIQRPSQPGYQQRAQERDGGIGRSTSPQTPAGYQAALHARSMSPQKPLTNGQTPGQHAYSPPRLHYQTPQQHQQAHQQQPQQQQQHAYSPRFSQPRPNTPSGYGGTNAGTPAPNALAYNANNLSTQPDSQQQSQRSPPLPQSAGSFTRFANVNANITNVGGMGSGGAPTTVGPPQQSSLKQESSTPVVPNDTASIDAKSPVPATAAAAAISSAS